LETTRKWWLFIVIRQHFIVGLRLILRALNTSEVMIHKVGGVDLLNGVLALMLRELCLNIIRVHESVISILDFYFIFMRVLPKYILTLLIIVFYLFRFAAAITVKHYCV
jgi:hypothetical protein